jgi:hypothetical protein
MIKTAKLLFIILILTVLFANIFVPAAFATDEPIYVGSEICGECHPDQFESFKKNSKKSKSYTGIKKMAAKLTPEELKECYACHTTGYGKLGGFLSEQETPHLKNNGCEVCHGPGSLHAESEDPEDLNATIDVEDCMTCHNSERVAVFNFKPLLYGGAH